MTDSSGSTTRATAATEFPPNRPDIHTLSECRGGGCQAVHIDSLGWPVDAESAAVARLTRHKSGEWLCAHGRYYLCCDEPNCPYRNERVRNDQPATAANIPYEGTDCTADEAVEAVEAVRVTAATEKAAYRSMPRRRCAYCDTLAVPGLTNHNNWPVCATHTTPEDLMETHTLIGDLTDAERLELDRLRKFVRRLAYVRSHMAAGDQAIMDALTDDRYDTVLAGLDRS